MGAPRALFVLTKIPRPGRVKTRLGQEIGMDHAAELAWALLEDTLRAAHTACASGAGRLWVCHAPDVAGAEFLERTRAVAPDTCFLPQGPGDLGQRLARALEHAEGSRIALGSDLPSLAPDRIMAGWELAAPGRLVLGPARDGGYYLIGLGAGVSPAPLRANVRWSGPETRADTVEAFARQGVEVQLLEEREDVDDLPALRRLQVELGQAPHRAPATHAWLRAHAHLLQGHKPLQRPE